MTETTLARTTRLEVTTHQHMMHYFADSHWHVVNNTLSPVKIGNKCLEQLNQSC